MHRSSPWPRRVSNVHSNAQNDAPFASVATEFEDLTGVIQNDLKVIVSILTERATERLLLSTRQSQQLQKIALEQPDRDDQRGARAALGGASLSASRAETAVGRRPAPSRSSSRWRESSWA